MQMRHGFARIWPVVEDEPETIFGKAKLFRDLGSLDEKMTQHLVIIRMRFGKARDRFLGNNQDVNGRLRFHVMKRNHLLVLINDLRGNFARDDFFKKGFAHLITKFRVSGFRIELISGEAFLIATRNSKHYSTKSAQFGWLDSVVKQFRKNSTI